MRTVTLFAPVQDTQGFDQNGLQSISGARWRVFR